MTLSAFSNFCAVLLLAVPFLTAQSHSSPLPPEVLNLSRIRRLVTSSAAQVPDYACLQTIQRFARRSSKQEFRPLDTVQLEVAIISNKEVYSWPGAETFEDLSPGAIVSAGTVSTGEFIQLLRAVFVGGTSTITWHGPETLHGRPALRYDWKLPLFGHQTHVSLQGGSGDVSQAGSFWADAESFELLRLEAHADEIPPGLPLAEMVSRIDYGRMTIHGREIWFPQSAELRLVKTDGMETRNLIEFSHCRQYGAQSELSFGTPAPTGPTSTAAPPSALQRITLPAGVPLDVRLDVEIDSASARVGQPITARLGADAVHRGKILMPAGAIIHGRIRRLERSSEFAPHFVVGLEFTSVESDSARARFYGQLEGIQSVAGASLTLRRSSRDKPIEFPATSGAPGFRVHRSESEVLSAREIPGVGSFFVAGERFKLPKALRMTWRTSEPPRR
jgi:hypothetical protein